MPHVVLLGDSIFDNAAYTGGGPDVVSQLRAVLPSGWEATLAAVDGSTTGNIGEQVPRLPRSASHLVLSIGGNDALMRADILELTAATTTQTLERLADVAAEFERRYRDAVQVCRATRLPLGVCTIYNGWFPDRAFQRVVSTALMVFNDAILRVAFEHGLPVIDLRLLCVDERDYANPIEPSSVGGAKIARAIAAVVTGADGDDSATRVVAR